MKQLLSLIRAGAPMMLLSVLSLVVLQACHSPIYQEVRVDCGGVGSRSNGVDSPPGTSCFKSPYPAGTHPLAERDSIVVATVNGVPNTPTNELLPPTATCNYNGTNNKCTIPGQQNCSLDSAMTCHDTWNKTNYKCDCLCLKLK